MENGISVEINLDRVLYISPKIQNYSERTKYIDMRYHFIREKIETGLVKVSYLKSEDQLADLFTKVLPKDRFIKLRSTLRVTKLS